MGYNRRTFANYPRKDHRGPGNTDAIYRLSDDAVLCSKTISVRPFSRGVPLVVDFGPLKEEERLEFAASEKLGLTSDELVVLRVRVVDDLMFLLGKQDHWNE